MSWLLNLAYLTLLCVLSPWLLWSAWRAGKYRQGWPAKFWGLVPQRDGEAICVWFHAVSLGEVNLLATLFDELSQRRPDLQYYITTTTLTGYQAACLRFSQHQVAYCPLDFSWAVRRAARRIRPHVLVLAELELWPNMIRAVRQRGGRVAVINGRLSNRSFRGYSRLQPVMRRLLAQIDLIATQTTAYADRFAALGAPRDRVVVTGSLKFDGAPTDRHNPTSQRLAQLVQLQEDDVVWIAGSTFPPEEELMVSVFRRLRVDFPQLRLFIVPRHPERFDEVADMLQRSGLPFQRRSQICAEQPGRSPLLLVDSVGELAAWWGMADVAFVGGSFGKRGGQNMIEPAAYGAAICFGPRTENFRDVVHSMLQSDAARVVHNDQSLEEFVRWSVCEPVLARQQGQRARDLVARHRGAARRTVDHLLAQLPPASKPARQPQRRSA